MSKPMYMLDTTAVLTLLEDEEGAERVEALLRNEEIVMPFLVLLETYYITLQEQTEDIADQRYALLKQLPVEYLYNVDEPTLLTTGRFKSRYRISLADALIAAFAVQLEATLVHKDPELEILGKQVKQEILPYKI